MAALSEFIQDGIRYVPTKAIAKSVGLSPRYLADFCRCGRVAAVFHKGAWYVQESSLHAFLAKQEREQAEYNRKLSEDAKREVEDNARKAAEVQARLVNEARTVRWRRTITKTLATTLVTCTLLISTALAFEMIAPPNSIAREHNKNNFASAHDQLAAVASLPFVDALASNIFNTLCPFFRNCPQAATHPVARQLPPPQNLRAVTAATSSPPALATSLAKTSAPTKTTVINQPVIERVRETVRTVIEGGINGSYVDERISALQQSLAQQIASVAAASHSESQTIYQTVGMVGRVEELSNTKLHSPTIDGATITGGSITAASISGTITAAINSAAATIAGLTSTTISATNVTFTNSTTTNATTTNLGLKKELGGFSGRFLTIAR